VFIEPRITNPTDMWADLAHIPNLRVPRYYWSTNRNVGATIQEYPDIISSSADNGLAHWVSGGGSAPTSGRDTTLELVEINLLVNEGFDGWFKQDDEC